MIYFNSFSIIEDFDAMIINEIINMRINVMPWHKYNTFALLKWNIILAVTFLVENIVISVLLV